MQPSLLELQRAFRSAVIFGDMEAIAPWLMAGRLPDSERLAIYRNNTQANLRNALRSDYPVIERLTGREFFDHVANAYLAATPSRSGDVGEFGADFPQFLAAFPAAASLPYLADVARLERAWCDVFLAADVAAGEFSGLAAIPPERLGGLRFSANPAMRLVSSPYPVLSIWKVNQPGCTGDDSVRLDAGAEHVLLRRRGAAVELHPVGLAEYAWLEAMVAGSSLAEAVDAAFNLQQDFDLPANLRRHIVEESFVSFIEDQNNEK
jgi:Putative DNA-binding domain